MKPLGVRKRKDFDSYGLASRAQEKRMSERYERTANGPARKGTLGSEPCDRASAYPFISNTQVQALGAAWSDYVRRTLLTDLGCVWYGPDECQTPGEGSDLQERSERAMQWHTSNSGKLSASPAAAYRKPPGYSE